MGSGGHGLEYILILLAAALLAATVLNRLRVPPLLAYLVTGLVIGQAGFALVPKGPIITALSDLGIVFLLFAIGLDLPLSRLTAMRRFIFGLGAAQVAVTFTVFALLLLAVPLIGLAKSGSGLIIAIAGGLALSSTATVVRLLVDRRETVTRFGRATIAVLLFQDLAVVPLLSLITAMASPGEAPRDLAGLGDAARGLAIGAAAIAAILFGGRLVLRPLFRVVAATDIPELFTGLCLLVVLSLGLLAEVAGMSMALGAFLAGLALADTPFRHQVDADLAPFRGLLLGLFFIAVGMVIDLEPVLESPLLVLGLTAALIAGKALLAGGLARLFGLTLAQAVRTGFLLAQAGEFTFVVANVSRGLGVMDDATASLISIVAALSLASTPLIVALSARLADRIEAATRDGALMPPGEDHVAAPVIIAGFGRVGRTVAQILADHEIAYVALDLSAQAVAGARAAGFEVYYGDSRQPAVLRSIGIGHASLAVIALDDVAAARASLLAIHDLSPGLPVIARAHDLAVARELRQAGATDVVPETIEASLQLAGRALGQQGVDAETVDAVLDRFRRMAEREADIISSTDDRDASNSQKRN